MVRKEVLVIIPARGGSKSIPRKNVKLLNGFPLIAYSIAAGLKAKLVNRVIVSTDYEEIANVALKFGAEVPFKRPAKYAEDLTPDLPVFVHALKWLKDHENYNPDVVVHLRPTSPVRPLNMVDEAVKSLLTHTDATCVRAVVTANENPYKMWRIKNTDSRMENLLNIKGIAEPYNAPRQALPQVYWQTGHIDAIRPDAILKGSMSGKSIYPLIIDSRFTVDIDTREDWKRAELQMKDLALSIVQP